MANRNHENLGGDGLSGGREALFVSLALFAGFLLRVIPSLFPTLWFDEIFTISISSQPVRELVRITRLDSHPPLYYLWLRVLVLSAEAGFGVVHSAWLRLGGSVLPSMLLCVAGWGLARRAWGKGPGLATLGHFCLSPVLAYYAVELRNYSFLMLLLVAAAGCGYMMMSEGGRRGWLWCVGHAAAVATALQTHNLAFIYLPFLLGLIVLALPYYRYGEKNRLVLAVAAVVLDLAGALAAWGPLAAQLAHHKVTYVWIPPPTWAGLFQTYAYFLPFGPLEGRLPVGGLPLAEAVAGFAAQAGLFGVGMAAWWRRRAAGWRIDPLIVMSGILATGPVLAAFVLHKLDKAPVFMPERYNMVAAPFWCLFVIGLGNAVLRDRPEWRRCLLIALLLVSLGYAIFGQRRRVLYRSDVRCLNGIGGPLQPHPESDVFVWTDDVFARWIPHNVDYTFWSRERLFAEAERGGIPPGARVFLIRHGAGLLPGNCERLHAGVLEAAVRFIPGTETIKSPGCWMMGNIWVIDGARAGGLKEHYEKALAWVNAEKKAQPGRMPRILPMDGAVVRGEGWNLPEIDDSHHVYAWSNGKHQTMILDQLPEGRHRVKTTFWRPQPFPTAEMKIKAKASSGVEWSEFNAPVGGVVVELEVQSGPAFPRAELEFEIPPWRPMDFVAGSPDDRQLGMMLLSVDIEPVE